MSVRLGNATRKATCHCAAQYFKTKNLTTRGYQMLDISKIYTSNNYGDFKILEHTSRDMVLIEFIGTGYQSSVNLSNAKAGAVKDKLKPSVLGVGFIGKGKYSISIKGRKTKAYTVWESMLKRCYYHKYHDKNPTYKDCSVTSEWHNFQVFAEWFELNYIKGFELDKDIKMNGNKVYSPRTCSFVSSVDNTIKAKSKHYTLTSPERVIVEIYNMSEFCRKNKLNIGHMCSVHSGKRRVHKGWTKP